MDIQQGDTRPSAVSSLASQKKKSSVTIIVTVIVVALVAGVGSWMFFRNQSPQVPPENGTEYQKAFSEIAPAEFAKLPDPSLTRQFVMGKNPVVLSAERFAPGKLFPETAEYWIEYRTESSAIDLRAELEEFLKKTSWKVASPVSGYPAGEAPSLVMERFGGKENLVVGMNEKDGEVQVRVIFATTFSFERSAPLANGEN